MNFTIFDVLDIISFIILGIFCFKINMKRLHVYTVNNCSGYENIKFDGRL